MSFDPQHYSVILVDVDKTLTRSDGTITQYTERAVMDAIAKGWVVGLCTGRSTITMTSLLRRVFPPESLHVCGGGSILITAQGEVKKIHALASTVFAEMLAFVSRTPLMYFFYTAENLYCSHPQDISAAQLAQRFQVTLQSQDTYLPNTPVLGLSIYGHWNTDEDWSSVFQQFLSQFRDDAECKLVTSASTGKLYLEITPQHVHKGTGVCEWCDITKIKSEQIVGVGDSENDVEFLQSVGWSVAMGNATPSIRTLANQTIGHADQDGLAHFLESLPRKES